MKATYKSRRNWSLIFWGAAAVIGWVFGIASDASWQAGSYGASDFMLALNLIFFIAATVAVFMACYYWARYKGRSGWFTLCGLVAPLGFLILTFMEDQWKEGPPPTDELPQPPPYIVAGGPPKI